MLFRNIKSILFTTPLNGPVRGAKAMNELHELRDAWMLVEDGLIVSIGDSSSCPPYQGEIVDCTGKYIMPCFTDSHTHIVYAASREKEYEMRIMGATYEEIAAAGGGILNSAAKLQGADENVLYSQAIERAWECIRMGTGAIEIKSGYGLTPDSELKMLRVIQRLKKTLPIPVKSTFLGAHAFPLIYRNDQESYMRQLLEEMLPAIAQEKLADYVDVFCDVGYFSPEQTDRIIKAAARLGIPARIHANELANSGGVQVGVANNVVSVDHLERIGSQEIELLAHSETIATLLPGTAYFLNIPYPPARALIDTGAIVSIASDYNPGSCPSGNINFLLSLASTKMKMRVAEALNAAVRNAAYALRLHNEVGAIAPGYRANFILTRPLSDIGALSYYFGNPQIDKVYINGEAIN